MPLVETRYEHIFLNAQNEPVISGTRTSVVQLVLDKIAYGWSPEELYFQHPHLTLGQIHSALAYYSDHQEEIDKIIEDQLKHIEKLRRSSVSSPLKKRLKAQNLI